MKKTLYFLLFLIFTAPSQVVAENWRLDMAHTNFFFEVRHTYAAVRGQFGDFSGKVIFDPASLEKSRFDFTIKVDSIDTKIGKRDTHLRSPEFFDEKKYPEIKFRSTKVTKGKDNEYFVDGKLTIKNVSKDLSLVYNYHGQKENPLKPGEIVSGFDTTLNIDRLAYGVGDGKFYKMGVVGKDVDILVTLELLRDN
jgi:polyisoprenoid-binding protein YceI